MRLEKEAWIPNVLWKGADHGVSLSPRALDFLECFAVSLQGATVWNTCGWSEVISFTREELHRVSLFTISSFCCSCLLCFPGDIITLLFFSPWSQICSLIKWRLRVWRISVLLKNRIIFGLSKNTMKSISILLKSHQKYQLHSFTIS